ncbi:MAG: hypothetical protein K2K04_01705 [Clostridia bacterium]|nr:hypothetical protein [Clostridia bacterium]
MKKILTFILSLVCCLCFTGCISSFVPEGSGGGSGQDTPGGTGNNDTPFTVKLAVDGEEFTPKKPLGAQWFNGESLYTADFVDGVATAYGLDGDYQVTLSELPDGYTYNPNINYATNRKKDVTIELLPLTRYFGAGTGWGSNACKFTETGTYKVTFTEAGQSVCCVFTPKDNGSYIIESIMDTFANEVNPRLEYFGQNTSWTPSAPYEVCKDGGVSAAYTRNFKYTADIDSDCINFTVKCDSRVDYPVNVYFTIQYASSYSRNPVYEMVVPKQLYDDNGNLKMSPSSSGAYVKCGREVGNTNHILDGSKFALGEDGYYHYKNGETLTSSLVYADLSPFLDPRTEQSASGTVTTSASLKVGLNDYTLFIRGWEGVVAIYVAESNVPEKYRQYKGMKGYKDTVVGNGKMCAVNEELRDFLQAYSADRQLFFDGLGSAEHAGYNSSDDDQWLYFCGYYI